MFNRKERLLCLLLAFAMVFGTLGGVASAASFDVIEVNGFDEGVDYTQKMIDCAKDGSEYALIAGEVYEKQRNLKIETLDLGYELTGYFGRGLTGEEILAEMFPPVAEEPTPTPEPVKTYSDEDLYWLSRVVYAEAGCDWFPDWVQRDVASVVLNRVSDSRYPSTIKDVIFDPGQYSCVDSGSIYREPSAKVIENCRWVLENGSTLPVSVIGQSAYAWGPVYKSYYDSVLGVTIKFFSC